MRGRAGPQQRRENRQVFGRGGETLPTVKKALITPLSMMPNHYSLVFTPPDTRPCQK